MKLPFQEPVVDKNGMMSQTSSWAKFLANQFEPSNSSSAPTHNSPIGGIHVTSEGIPYIYTINGWQKISGT